MFLTDAQLAAEIDRCEYCADKPCQGMCPADCSPADFIMAREARRDDRLPPRRRADHGGEPARRRLRRGLPRHALHAGLRARRTFDRAIEIPAIQATIIDEARRLGVMPDLAQRPAHGQARGGGRRRARRATAPPRCWPSRGSRSTFSRPGRGRRHGRPHPGLPPRPRGAGRRPRLRGGARRRHGDDRRARSATPVRCWRGASTPSSSPPAWREPIRLGDPGRGAGDPGPRAGSATREPHARRPAGGGGGRRRRRRRLRRDAAERGARHVELFALEKLSEMPLTAKELRALMAAGVHVSGRTRVTRDPGSATGRSRACELQGRPAGRGAVPPPERRRPAGHRADARRLRRGDRGDRRRRGADRSLPRPACSSPATSRTARPPWSRRWPPARTPLPRSTATWVSRPRRATGPDRGIRRRRDQEHRRPARLRAGCPCRSTRLLRPADPLAVPALGRARHRRLRADAPGLRGGLGRRRDEDGVRQRADPHPRRLHVRLRPVDLRQLRQRLRPPARPGLPRGRAAAPRVPGPADARLDRRPGDRQRRARRVVLAVQHPEARERRRDGGRVQPVLPAGRRRHQGRHRLAGPRAHGRIIDWVLPPATPRCRSSSS